MNAAINGSSPAHILVLEDDRDILEAMRVILTTKGYSVTAMSSADDLETTIAQEVPDLFLLDVWVGSNDGRDVARWLKEHPSTQHVPIIMVSANISTPQIAKEVKADDFILKPFDLDHLLSVVEKRLKKGPRSAKSN